VFFILIVHSQVFANDNENSKVTTSVSDQLKTLQDLYKSGVLSGYEYEKEKKKILNN
jgi:hypothetical protein